jgi:glycerol-3-phosphate cytidylyltransferase
MKVGIAFSTFNLLHSGHMKILEEAKRLFDYLLGLQSDLCIYRFDKNGSSQSIIHCYIQLKKSKYLNEIIPYETDKI